MGGGGGHTQGSNPGLWSKTKFDMFHIYCNAVCMQISEYLTFDFPLGAKQGVGVKF